MATATKQDPRPPGDAAEGSAAVPAPDRPGTFRRARTWLLVATATALIAVGAAVGVMNTADDPAPRPVDERPTEDEVMRRLVRNGYLPKESLEDAPTSSDEPDL